jgi:hypothetical protein
LLLHSFWALMFGREKNLVAISIGDLCSRAVGSAGGTLTNHHSRFQ